MQIHFGAPALAVALVVAAPAGAVHTPPAVRRAADDAHAVVIMLKAPARGTEAGSWRRAFAARARALGARVRDTPADPRVPWTLRVLRVDPDPVLLAALDPSPEPAGSRFAGATRGAAALARHVAGDPAVAWAEPDYLREPAYGVNDSLPPEPLLTDTRQWGLWNAGPGSAYGGTARADIHALEAWRMAAGPERARPILLAVADTGIDPSHPEFAGGYGGAPRIAHGRSIADPAISIHDSLGHGTMVAGIMAAAIGEGFHFDSLGMAGVCGDCVIAPLRITRGARRTASSFDIALAILHATGHGARAMNLSFAGGGHSRLERLALTHAVTHGTLVVAASGNRGYTDPKALMYPAAYAADGLCLAVGASDPWDRRALFSSYGDHLDLVAPGLDIWSTWMTYPAATGAIYSGYVAGSGTSFAAPFATGTTGLLAAARPELSASDLRHLLRRSADDIGAPGMDAETGAGRLNAARALAAIGGDTGLWHDEAAASEWRDEGRGDLVLGEDGPGAFAARWSGRAATRVECTARIALPDSFADGATAWPRNAGTTTLRASFTQPWHAPWCEARLEGRTLVLTGYAFRLEGGAGGVADDLWIPLPPDQMRFGFTVLGPLRRSAPEAPPAPAPRLVMYPNPTRGPAIIEAPAAGRVTIFDVRGRLVWKAAGAGPIEWPGADVSGRRAPPGLYFVVFEGDGARRAGRLVRLR